MATTLISVEEYLKTTSKPEPEFVRGVLKERSVPDWDHSAWQSALIGWFRDHQNEWGIRVFPELRIQVTTDQFRIPDVTILSRKASREEFLTHPPLAVFEILSPGDSMTDLLEKLQAYEAMGIPAIWVIDPRKTVYRRYYQGKLVEASLFELPGTTLRVRISEIATLTE